MKYFVFVFILLSVTFRLAYSQDNDKGNENFLEIQVMINDDLDYHYNSIFQKSARLTSTQKLFIYDDKSESAVGPFFLNLFIGFGVGSWVQGHTTDGLIGTLGQLGGFALIYSRENGLVTIGAITFLTSYVCGLILPFTSASSFNSKLKSALRMSDLSSISIRPTLNLANNKVLYPGASLIINF